MDEPCEAKKGAGNNVPSGVWGWPHRNPNPQTKKRAEPASDCKAVYD